MRMNALSVLLAVALVLFGASSAAIGFPAAAGLATLAALALMTWRLFSRSTCSMDLVVALMYFALASGVIGFAGRPG